MTSRAVHTPRISRRAPPGRPVARSAKQRSLIELYLPTALFYALLMPTGLSLNLGGIELFPFRVLLLASIPWLFARYVQRPTLGELPDWLLLFTAFWIVIVLIYHMGLSGVESAGREIVDLLVGYLIARSTVRSTDDLRRVLRLTLPGLAVVAMILAVESVTSRLLIYPLFPTTAYEYTTEQFRFGLLRAWGPFPHPILGGVFIGSFLALYFGFTKNPWYRFAGMATACAAFFTLSSAGIILLVFSAGLLGYALLCRILFGRVVWIPVIAGGLFIAVVLQLVTDSGALNTLVRYAALNPQTGYFRLLIWEYGTRSVANYPIFGIGYEAYERLEWMNTSSIDNYWLTIAVRYGLPAIIPFMLFAVLAIYSANRARQLLPRSEADLLLGLTISLSAVWLAVWSVALWLSPLVAFMFFLGVAVSLRRYAALRAAALRRIHTEMALRANNNIQTHHSKGRTKPSFGQE